MDKQAIAKWKLAALANMGTSARNAVRTGAALNTKELDLYHRFLRENPRTKAGLDRFFKENPAFQTANDDFTRRPKAWLFSRPAGRSYAEYSGFPRYMEDGIRNGTVVKAPTPHDPNRMVFRSVPADAVRLYAGFGSTDLSKLAMPENPVAVGINDRLNRIVGFHLFGSKFGTPAASGRPAVVFANKFEKPPMFGAAEYPYSPNYSQMTDTVTMPSPDGFWSYSKIIQDAARDRHFGKNINASRPKYMRATYQHESDGHGGLFRLSPQDLVRETRRAMYNTKRALRGTGLHVSSDNTLGGYDPMIEFMANYRASNPGTALRSFAVSKFDAGPLGKRIGEAFDKNMANVNQDTVARIKAGLEQLDGNYNALHSDILADKGNWSKYVAAESAILDGIAPKNNIPAWRSLLNRISGKKQ